MLIEAFNSLFYGIIFFGLFLIDYMLGNGFVDMFQKLFCKIKCLIKEVVKEEAKQTQTTGAKFPISLPIILTEILVLSLTMAILKKYKQVRGKDRFDELLHEGNATLRQSNEFLDKWRLRRTLDTNRSQPESGDAGDRFNITDSTLLSVTSLLDDDMEITEPVSEEKIIDVAKNVEFKNRFLWDVMEEDVNNLED